jgi:hypothetical protein
LVDGTKKIRDDQHLLKATKLIASHFASKEDKIRDLALEAGDERAQAKHHAQDCTKQNGDFDDLWYQSFTQRL